MAAMERNSDVISMQCYAPLFANVNEYQWRPDLIGYDALNSFGSPSYYALRLFSRNVGDSILKATFDTPSADQGMTVHHSVTKDSKTGIIYVKLVNPQSTPQPLTIVLKGIDSLVSTADVETLAGDLTATNSIKEPLAVVPGSSKLSNVKPSFSFKLPASSITVLSLKSRN